VCVTNKCVLPCCLVCVLTIGCDVGGDEAAADNRCAHRPPPPAIVNPFTYLCGQVAHTSANCRRFLISTSSFGTAQLCEWHGRCVAGSVVDCEIPLPALPPPYPPYAAPRPPAPSVSEVLAHAQNTSKLEFVGAFVGSMRSHVSTSLHEIDDAVQRSAQVVAEHTSIPASVIYVFIASQGALFFALALRWALTLSCGFSRSSTHRAPWGVAPAPPRTLHTVHPSRLIVLCTADRLVIVPAAFCDHVSLLNCALPLGATKAP